MTFCIDLRERFGGKFKVEYEASYHAERGAAGRQDDPWLCIIPCQHGHIYPHGGEWLAASTNCRGPVASRLAELPGVKTLQDADDGLNVAFPVEAFDAVAGVMKPRRRRRLSPEQRAEHIDRLRKHQFTPATQDAGEDRGRAASPTKPKNPPKRRIAS